MNKNMVVPQNYKNFILEIKNKVKSANIKVYKKANTDLIYLYFDVGKIIFDKIELAGWGKSVVKILSKELEKEFGKRSGYSVQNLWYMKKFYLTYKDNKFLQQAVGEIPWGQNIAILDKCKSIQEKEFYIKLTIEKGLSRNVLIHQIEGQAFLTSQNKIQSNFDLSIPEKSDLIKGLVKDNYILSFLGLSEKYSERELENKILENIKQFLLELGGDFCFIGNQYKLSLDGNDYFIDILFYNRTLKCLFAIELKVGEFKPEYVGKMNFYLELLDQQIKKENENPSVGIVLCKKKSKLIVEVALRNASKPISVATYKITKKLEDKFII